MKVAFVKQQLDVFGPWTSVLWRNTNPRHLFDCWPGKAVFWEMTCLLQADWYVIPQQVTNAYIFDAVVRVSGRRELMEAHTTTVKHVPFEEYDVVITFDPILQRSVPSEVLLAYYAQEHWDPVYRRSLHAPAPGYDLFLDHMLAAPSELRQMPQTVGFPYLRAPAVARQEFSAAEKDEVVWVEARAVSTLAMSETWDDSCSAALSRFERVIGLPTRSRRHGIKEEPYAISNPPAWGDARTYLSDLGRCRYFASFGRVAGAGQGLCDAASLGCLCVGERGKAYHRVVCHPAALCDDMQDVPQALKRLFASEALRQEVLAWQDRALEEHFGKRPLALLADAAATKRSAVRTR